MTNEKEPIALKDILHCCLFWAVVTYVVASYPMLYCMMKHNVPPYEPYCGDRDTSSYQHTDFVLMRSLQIIGSPVVLPFAGLYALAQNTITYGEET